MRVLMVCPSYPPRDGTCGVGDYTRCLVEAMARLGDEVTVLTRPGYLGTREDGVEVVTAETSSPRRAPAVDVVDVQYTPELYRDDRRVLLAPLRARLGRVAPTVVTFHTLLDGSVLSRLAAPWLLATASRVISTNEEVTGMIRRRLPMLAHRLVEIPIGANVPGVQVEQGTTREAIRRRAGLPVDAPVLACFGLVYPGKGLETLIEALALVRRDEARAHLAVIGDTRAADRPYRAGLDGLAGRLGVATAVTWAGALDAMDVSRVVSACDLLVLPFDGGASIRRSSLIAGLALGAPVITTTLAVPSQYLRDGDNVSIVPPRDPQALAARIVELLREPALAARLAKGARHVAERFAWPAIAAATRQILSSAVGR